MAQIDERIHLFKTGNLSNLYNMARSIVSLSPQQQKTNLINKTL